MFAALTIEREPLTFTWDTFLGALNSWTQIAGGFAMLALVLWLIAHWRVRQRPFSSSPAAQMSSSTTAALVTVLFGPIGALVYAYTAGRRKSADVVELPAGPYEPRRRTLMATLFVAAVIWAAF